MKKKKRDYREEDDMAGLGGNGAAVLETKRRKAYN